MFHGHSLPIFMRVRNSRAKVSLTAKLAKENSLIWQLCMGSNAEYYRKFYVPCSQSYLKVGQFLVHCKFAHHCPYFPVIFWPYLKLTSKQPDFTPTEPVFSNFLRIFLQTFGKHRATIFLHII